MTKVTLDQATLSRLGSLDQDIEICDESGRTLGFFMSVSRDSLYKRSHPPASSAELQRRDDEESGRNLQEILADLRERG